MSCCCSGYIDVDEVIDMFRDLGVALDRHEALRLIKRYYLTSFVSFCVVMILIDLPDTIENCGWWEVDLLLISLDHHLTVDKLNHSVNYGSFESHSTSSVVRYFSHYSWNIMVQLGVHMYNVAWMAWVVGINEYDARYSWGIPREIPASLCPCIHVYVAGLQ